jgi:hypothetical protein
VPASWVRIISCRSSRPAQPGISLQAGQELIAGPLDADGRRRAVAGQHPRLVRQRQADPGQAVHHGGGVAARQVGPPDRSGEQQVAGEHDGRVGVEDDRPRGVPGRVVDRDLQAGQVQHGPVGQFPDVVRLGELQAPE